MPSGYKDMTKAQLVRVIKGKTARANPMAKRIAYGGLERQSKSELIRQAKKARVVSGGDISYR